MWVFAYGSLIFRPGFEFLNQVRGSVDGYTRK
ncbi:MAG: gamma-glutamylcyclotransferase, partial [Deltaproteobacteria bacterium]|nr:gamma-glutamylcyclotransferase [Deltaproteobacteria bacterium]